MTSPHGKAAEDLVELICTKACLRDFVIRSAKFVKPGGREKEVADLLLPFDGRLLAVQVKSRDTGKGTREVELNRLATKAKEGGKQIDTTARAIRAGRLARLQNRYEVDVSPRDGSPWELIGIVVVDTTMAPVPDLATVPDVPGFGIDDNKTPIHYFMRQEFEAVLQELDTTPDILRYLDFRQRVHQAGISPATIELDLLATFKTRQPLVDRVLASGSGLVVTPGMWTEYRSLHSSAIAARDAANELSYIVDGWIEFYHSILDYPAPHADRSLPGMESINSTESYARLITELGRLHRVARRVVGEMVMEKCHKAIRQPWSYGLQLIAPKYGILFVSTAMAREQRMGFLHDMAIMAYCAHDLESILAIATEPANVDAQSLDGLFLDGYESEHKQEIKTQGLKLFKLPEYRLTQEYPDGFG